MAEIGRNCIHRCPTCGSTRMRTVRGTYDTTIHGRSVRVPDVEREECSQCGEVLLGPEAMRRIGALWEPQKQVGSLP